jgi:hypothetical protein
MPRKATGCLPDDHQAVAATLKARIERLEANSPGWRLLQRPFHRADFEREREQCEPLMATVLNGTADLMVAREAQARLAGGLEALQARAKSECRLSWERSRKLRARE